MCNHFYPDCHPNIPQVRLDRTADVNAEMMHATIETATALAELGRSARTVLHAARHAGRILLRRVGLPEVSTHWPATTSADLSANPASL